MRQVLALEPIVWGDGNADRGADDRALVVDGIGLRDHLDDLLGQLAEFAAVVHIGQDDLELVSAQPTDLSAVADDPVQPLGHLLEQVVACLVAHRVIHMLEAVEIEHEQGARALGLAVGRKQAVQPTVHPVAIGQPCQRIVFRQPGFLDLALVFAGHVLGAAAIAEETVFLIELRAAGNRPPDLPRLVLRFAECEAHYEIGNLVVRRNLEVERAVRAFVGIVGIGLEKVGQRLREDIGDVVAQLLGRGFGDIDQAALLVGRPYPAKAAHLEIVEDCEPARLVASADDRDLAVLGSILGRRAAAEIDQTFEQAFPAHNPSSFAPFASVRNTARPA